MFDEFIYQFSMACKWRRGINKNDETFNKINNDDEEKAFWNVETIN
jgi:hypothetical protein